MEPRKARVGEEARAPLERAVALRFKHFGDFVDGLSANLSTGGMFIRTRQPHPVGAVLEFRLRLDEDRAPIAGKAQVVWVRRRSQYLDEPVGMGVRFVELDDESRQQIADLVGANQADGGRSPEIGPAGEPADDGAATVGAETAAAAGLSATGPEPASATAAPVRAAETSGSAVAVAASSSPRRPPTLWILLSAVLAVALGASLWRRPAVDAPPAATLPSEASPTAGPPADGAAPATEAAAVPEQIGVVHDWARAWSEQRVDDYLGAYSVRFTPPGGLDRATWESQRRTRILAPQRIEVGLAFVELEELEPGRSLVRFIQAYESDSYGDIVRKLLVLEREEDGWRIVQEGVEP